MEFTMTGFSQDQGIRRYKFKALTMDRTSHEFSVDTDVALARRYGISLQELPLLCRRLLDRDAPTQETRAFTFSEELMREHAEQHAAALRAAQEKRKTHRRPSTALSGAQWRGLA